MMYTLCTPLAHTEQRRTPQLASIVDLFPFRTHTSHDEKRLQQDCSTMRVPLVGAAA